MIRRAVSLSFVLLVSLISLAQKPEGKPSEKSANAQDYSQESFVVEQIRTNYRFEKDGTGRKEIYARIRVQSEAGVSQWGQVVVGYNSANERVEIPYVRVHKADGSIVTAPPDAVQDLSSPVQREAPVYTDYRQKHITVPGLRPGEQLEYDIVTVIHTAMAPNQFWMDYDFDKSSIVLNEQLEVDVPRERVVKLKTKAGYDAKISDEKDRRVYRWTASNLVREDDEKPKDKKKKKKKTDETPTVQMTTFPSWESVGQWYAGLERDRRVPSAEIRAKAQELTKGLNSDSDKIQALYDYVSTNFRYVSLSLGLARYQPHAADDVFKNQYGDCKDKHTLLESMLEASGYKASSVLINSSRKLDPDVPSPSQFDHVITLLPLGKDEIWMDTTAEIAPYRLLSFNLRKKQALVVPPDGAGRLEETPADPPMPNSQLEELEGKVSELGKLTMHVHYTMRGDTELVMRTIFRRVPRPQWQRMVETMNTMGGLDGEVTDLKVGDPAATRKPFEFEYTISKANYFDWSKKKSQFDLPLSQFPLPDADTDEDNDDNAPDSDAIKFGPPGEYVYHIKVELPPKYSAVNPLPFAMKRDYAEYQAGYKLDQNIFTADRKLVVRERELDSSRASDYLAFRRAVLSDLVQHVSMESASAGNPTPPPNLKADELNESGFSALQNGNYPLAVSLLKRAVEVEPKHKAAWNNLGNAYLAQRETAEAIAAFKKQAEVNPYDEFAYNNMGRAYWLDRNYEEAAKAFHKQIEVNPLDRFAHSNLGTMYGEWHKYDEAVPELEKAVSLNADDPILQVNLGDAYLNLGQDDKALAAFDKAIELSATPVVWNNIAYQLSLKKAHLDKAQQYAESAVAATAAGLRNVTLEQLSVRDLGLVPSLVAYWDTLGWVYFAKGDLKNAEKYVSAAWLIGEHGEVGDHLGQIYEKRGEREKAIQTYALALQALRPTPETRARLAALVGGEAKIPATTAKYKDELQELRSVNLGNAAKEDGTAEFFVLFSAFGSGVTVENVKFVSGDEKLKNMTEALRTMKYNVRLPDDTQAKILRRGVLSCTKATGNCKFVMLLTDDVRSVD